MGAAKLQRSFCGLMKEGGVVGPTQDIYICPDCVRLAAQIIELQGSIGRPPRARRRRRTRPRSRNLRVAWRQRPCDSYAAPARFEPGIRCA